jgi:uncharacterized protein (TIGR04255 family)
MKVVAQLVFPPVVSLLDANYIAGFQEQIRARYPILTQEPRIGPLSSPSGMMTMNLVNIWRFRSSELRRSGDV